LDPEQKDALSEIVEILLQDNSTAVIGSAIAAFCEVCPERIDLIHPIFRKLCRMCADTDEWGQVLIINTLYRYGRSQFVDPNKDEPKDAPEKKKKQKKKSSAFYSDDERSPSESEQEESEDDDYGHQLDPDHSMLLSCTEPLLRSRNSAVVVAVATLFHYLAPRAWMLKAGKSLVRIMKGSREVQFAVLSNIATLVLHRKV
jgi:AP-3 complex subunit beta